MLVTNGNKIVTLPHNVEELERIEKILKKRAKDVLGVAKAKFTLEEQPFPHLVNQNEFSFKELKQMCMPDIEIQFRAIGKESVQLPDTRMKDIKHVYSPEEKASIADQICNDQYDKEKVEVEAKASAKAFKQTIEAFESNIRENANKHRQGYEMQNVECLLHLDFENGTRIFTDKNTGDILSTEPLEPKDRQLMIEFRNGEFEGGTAPVEEEPGETADADAPDENGGDEGHSDDPFGQE